MVQPHKDVPLMLWIISGKNAMQLFLMLVVVLSGVPVMLGLAAPAIAKNVLPDWGVILWGAALSVGGMLSLVGTYWRSPAHDNGLRIEQWAKAILCGASTVYPTCLLIAAPDKASAAFTITITYGFALACAGRLWQIQRDRRQYRVFRDAIAGVE